MKSVHCLQDSTFSSYTGPTYIECFMESASVWYFYARVGKCVYRDDKLSATYYCSRQKEKSRGFCSCSRGSRLVISLVFLLSMLSKYSSTEVAYATSLFSLIFFKEIRLWKLSVERICLILRTAWKDNPRDTAHMWRNMIRGFWLDVSFSPHVKKVISDI